MNIICKYICIHISSFNLLKYENITYSPQLYIVQIEMREIYDKVVNNHISQHHLDIKHKGYLRSYMPLDLD
jgi:hypothetical protein